MLRTRAQRVGEDRVDVWSAFHDCGFAVEFDRRSVSELDRVVVEGSGLAGRRSGRWRSVPVQLSFCVEQAGGGVDDPQGGLIGPPRLKIAMR